MDSRWARWAVVLGVALGGFFDGILLHQILQWHHLLSLVPEAGDLRMQVLWDGWFHASMYLLAVAGLWGLWRHRPAEGLAGRALGGALLLGFGLWHVADTLLSHWLLGIHRVRIDSAAPLLWDVLWLGLFGIAPLAAGLWLRRRRAATLRNFPAAMLLLAAGTAGAGTWALQPPARQLYTTVVFAPGTAPRQVFDALDATGARLVWADRAMGVVVVAVQPHRRWGFYRHRALLVGGTALGAGCFSWSRPGPG